MAASNKRSDLIDAWGSATDIHDSPLPDAQSPARTLIVVNLVAVGHPVVRRDAEPTPGFAQYYASGP